MARYTGPKTRIARKFGEAIFGDDKAFEEEVTHWTTRDGEKGKKNLNMLSS
jgi:hypothetical protein